MQQLAGDREREDHRPLLVGAVADQHVATVVFGQRGVGAERAPRGFGVGELPQELVELQRLAVGVLHPRWGQAAPDELGDLERIRTVERVEDLVAQRAPTVTNPEYARHVSPTGSGRPSMRSPRRVCDSAFVFVTVMRSPVRRSRSFR